MEETTPQLQENTCLKILSALKATNNFHIILAVSTVLSISYGVAHKTVYEELLTTDLL